MHHPSDRELVLHTLDPGEETGIRAHLQTCEECTRRFHSFARAIEAVGRIEVPVLSREEEEDVFATAWRSSRRLEPQPRVFPPLWHWFFQPVALFACGLLAGYLAFATQQPASSPVVAPPAEVVQAPGPLSTAEPPLAVTPVPTESGSPPATTPVPDGGSKEDFWQMAGLRNVKVTPTVRYEDGKLVRGARLEGETLNGALVVMAF